MYARYAGGITNVKNIEGDKMDILEGIILSLISVLIFALGHELLHYLTAKALGMEVKIIPKWWGFYVYMPETSGKKWAELEERVKTKYNLVAIAPYILFIPLFLLLTIYFTGNSDFLYSISITLLIVNFISLPMEWMVK